jgi:hypothetical protein
MLTTTIIYLLGFIITLPLVYKSIGKDGFELYPMLTKDERIWLVFFTILHSTFSWFMVFYLLYLNNFKNGNR